MASPRQTLLKNRLAFVREELDEAVGHITPDMLGWAPAEGMRTVGGQLVEIIGTEMQLLERMRTGRLITDPEARELIGDCDSLEVLKGALVSFREETLRYLESFSEDQLAEEVPCQGRSLRCLGLDAVPRAELFISIASHEWYHVGQLISYLWARGDNPYHW